MSSDVIISFEDLGKRYRINQQLENQRYTALREVIAHRVRRVLDFRKPASGSSTATDFWALKDVTFEVRRGEVVGIIGRNGAGKSTLLKIASRITEPTEGRVRLRGRVASLLEVGTGFHPELTGRENIFLNGAILGMTRAEIKGKFDEIVAFAEVEQFLDTPVKRYSSGMYVRLAFAVAAHLEPEILVVDEVLAVGDAQFQKKCLGKMGEVASGGRTVLFVSHNMSAIQALCPKAVLLNAGRVQFVGPSAEAAGVYLDRSDQSTYLERPARLDGIPTVTRLVVESVDVREETQIKVRFEVTSSIRMRGSFEVKLSDSYYGPIGIASVGLVDPGESVEFCEGREAITCVLTLPRLAKGVYRAMVQLTVPLVKILDSTGDGVVFEVHPVPLGESQRAIELTWGCGALEIPMRISRGGAS
jgi:lipopolysaccharide transport system ATP-binding protein